MMHKNNKYLIVFSVLTLCLSTYGTLSTLNKNTAIGAGICAMTGAAVSVALEARQLAE
jgi:hypothetical protein